MGDFEKFKNMDINEVHNKTRITLIRLQDILDKKFDKIDPTRAYGFIKILERELQLDLSEWVKEYNSHRNLTDTKPTNNNNINNVSDKSLDITHNDNIANSSTNDSKESDSNNLNNKDKQSNTYANKPKNKKQLNNMCIEINIPKRRNSYKTIIIVAVIAVILIIVVLGMYFTNPTNKNQQNILEQNDIKQQIIEKNINKTYPTISLKDALQDIEQDTNHDNKTIIEHNIIQKNDSNEVEEEKPTEEKQFQQNIITITPKNDVWFAWVDTITKQRGEKYTKKTPVSINANNPIAFHFGYAALNIEINGKTFDFNQMGVTYMLYDGKQDIKIITQKEYKAFGGK